MSRRHIIDIRIFVCEVKMTTDWVIFNTYEQVKSQDYLNDLQYPMTTGWVFFTNK